MVGSVGLSALGDWLALIPLALHVEERTGSGLAVAALFVAVWSPAIVLAGVAGALVDRVETRRLLIAVSLGQAAVAGGLLFVESEAAILALAAALGAGFALAQPAEFALVPVVAGERGVPVANAHVETARYVGFTVGPLAGGFLSAAGGTTVALAVNAASFLVVAAAAAGLHARRPPERHGDAATARARDGLTLLTADRALRLVLGAGFVSLLFMTASVPAEVFFVKDVLDAGDVAYGAVATAWFLGMVAGARLLAPRVAGGALVTASLAAMAVQSAGLALPTVWLVLPLAFVAYAIGGAGHGTKNVLIRTLIHERVAAAAHGRAFAAYNGLRNAAELPALLGGGALIAAAGPRVTLLVAGGVPLVVALVALGRLRREPLSAVGPARPAAVVAR